MPTADAGPFAEWILGMQRAMADGTASDVPCEGCVACCTSGNRIPVDDGELEARRAAPVSAEGYIEPDDRGRCPMLADHDDRCTIYEHRPRACRTYDCRIFPATGVEPDDDKPLIAARAAQWRFRLETDDDIRRQQAARMAAVTLRHVQTDGRATSRTQLAAQAVAVHDELL